jgi:acyl-CoA synthetase (NDP forming)
VEFFTHANLPRGRGIGGITFSGALRGLLLDVAEFNGLSFPPLAEATQARLKAVLGVGTIVGNPLDSGFSGLTNREAYVKSLEIMLDDPSIDLLLIQAELPAAPGLERAEGNLRAADAVAAKARKPIVGFSFASHGVTDYAREFRTGVPHLPFLQEVDKAMRALRHACDYAGSMAEPPAAPAVVIRSQAKEKLEKILARRRGHRSLSEVESKALLKAYGIRAPKEAVTGSAAEAAAAAKRIGFPVVAKAVSASLAHKSEAGGVVVGLDTPKAVREAYAKIVEAVRSHTGAAPDGVLIAEQVTGGTELVLGANRDPEVGPVILFGTGGIELELVRDVALAAPPLDERKALQLIERTRAARLIAGFRGRPPLDRDAAVAALVGLSQLVLDAGPRLQSIDVNPFLLRPRGGVALDALVVLAEHS